MLYQLERGSVERVATAGDQEDPVSWIKQHLPERAQCSMVSDIMDEAYIRNMLPPIWLSGTRQALLKRRLTQQLRDNLYRSAVLAPSGTFRPPTRASLIGMGQSERIGQWLAALTARQVRVKGLWPLSALIALNVNQKAPRREVADATTKPAGVRPILALVATPAGLRQVLVRGRLPMFSRLALGSSENSESVQFVLAEARRTVQYLISQEWLTSEEQPIATQMWVPVGGEEDLSGTGSDPALDVQFVVTTPDAYAHLLTHLKTASAQLQFLPEESRTEWRAAQIATAAKTTAFAVLALTTLWSADLLWGSWGRNNLAQEQVARAVTINAQARQEVLQAKGDLTEAGLAVAAVQVWQASIQAQPHQVAAFQHLAAALRTAPGLSVEKLGWELLPVVTEGAVPAVKVPFGCPKPVTETSPDPVPTPEPAKPVVAILNVTASVVEDISLRRALQLQNVLLAQLNQAGWSAVMVKSTVNFDPAQAQVGTVGKPGTRTLEICVERTAP